MVNMEESGAVYPWMAYVQRYSPQIIPKSLNILFKLVASNCGGTIISKGYYKYISAIVPANNANSLLYLYIYIQLYI